MLRALGKHRRLEIEGILLTKVQTGAKHPKAIINVIRAEYGADVPIFDTTIPLSIKAADASAARTSVLTYDPHCTVAQAYTALADELLGGDENG